MKIAVAHGKGLRWGTGRGLLSLKVILGCPRIKKDIAPDGSTG